MKEQMAMIVDFFSKEDDPPTYHMDVMPRSVKALNYKLSQGWRVVMCCPMSGPEPTRTALALVILEKE